MTSIRPLSDSFGRIIRDLRISLTDRYNFRCLYCLPETEEAANFYRTRFDSVRNPNPTAPKLPDWKPRSELLTFEEIERLVRLGASLGIEKIRFFTVGVNLRIEVIEDYDFVSRFDEIIDYI